MLSSDKKSIRPARLGPELHFRTGSYRYRSKVCACNRVHLLFGDWSRQSLHSAVLPTSLGPGCLKDIRLGDVGQYRLYRPLQHCLNLGTYTGLQANLGILGSSKHHQATAGIQVPLFRRRRRRLHCQHHIMRPGSLDRRSSYLSLLESSDTGSTKTSIIRHLCHGLRRGRVGSLASILQLVHLLWHLRYHMVDMEPLTYLHARAAYRVPMRQRSRHEGLLQTLLPGKA